VTRTTVDGTDTLYSQTTTRAGVARFDCLRSASGTCHYTVIPRNCPPALVALNRQRGHCGPKAIERFTIAKGESRQITGLQDFRLCVSGGDNVTDDECEASQPLAKQ
ncbi:MAG TPA: hypothetical protein VLZ76_00075, partial [Lysobacter sp.]|nr:hypothetical protein [Lysobacter sp.]